MNRIRISSRLLKIAKMMITASIISKFEESMKKKNPGIKNDDLKEMSKFIESCNNSTKIKNLAVYLLLNDFLEFPDNKNEFDIISQIFKNFRNLDYNKIKDKKDYDKFIHPEKYMNEDDNCKKYFKSLNKQKLKKERLDGTFNPDAEFKGRKYKNKNITIYTLEETPEEMQRVRRALDVAYGIYRNPWCLAARTDDDDISFEPKSDNFEESWKMWEHYNKSPKRIAFQNNNPVAFYADDRWWDLDDQHHDDFPIAGIIDDKEFIDERKKHNELLKKLRSGGYFTDDELRVLAEDRKQEVRIAVAKRRNLPVEILQILSEDNDWNIRYIIAQKENLPDNLMKKLSEDEEESVIQMIAGRDDLPGNLIEELSKNKNKSVRYTIAERNDLPYDIMETLAEDDYEWTRVSISYKKNLPYNIMKALSEDKRSSVREAISKRERLPEDIMRILAVDENIKVKWSLAERKDLPESIMEMLAEDDLEWIRKIISGRKDLPGYLMEKLSEDKEWPVRKKIAERDDLSYDLIEKLAGDKDTNIREAIAERKNLPKNIIKMLSEDNDEDIRKALRENYDI